MVAATLIIHPEVQQALSENQPIVALESTVITHGLPYPQNVETAFDMETSVRDSGAIPATVAILHGQVHVGLTAEQIEYLATRSKTQVRKCSRRDLPLVVSSKMDGATTVAGTMIIASLTGIELFATGGIGGVHRGHPYDVSADLSELGRTPITVVCSGAKSILDLPLTREVLETNGVPVIGYQTDEMPAFFSRSSGLPVDIRLDSPDEIAATIIARQALHLDSGLLVTVPVPKEDEFASQAAEEAIKSATQEADKAGIVGPAATPWLLSRVAELTGGQSIRANLSLLRNNGRVAGAIASALKQQEKD